MAARLDVLQGRESLMNAKNLLTYTSLNPMMFGLSEPGTTNYGEGRGAMPWQGPELLWKF